MQFQKLTKSIVQLSVPLLILGAPNIYLTIVRLNIGESEKLFGSLLLILFFLAAILLLPAIFNLRLRTYLLLLSPLIILIPLVLFNISLNKQFPNHWLLLTTWYDINDAFELFKEQGWAILYLPLLLLIYCIWTIKAIPSRLKLMPWARALIILSFTILLIYDFTESQKTQVSFSEQLYNRADLVYPWGILRDFYQVYEEVEMIEAHEEILADFRFNALSNRPAELKETYVLFLGETARYQNWSINGYKRKTNPELEKIDLTVFNDMSALASTTVKAIPLMLTNAGPENFREAFKKRSFIQAFKEAGFEVIWLSNLHRFGKHDTNTSIYAEEADTCIYNEEIEEGEKFKLDQSLLPLYDNILKDEHPKKLIIVHTLGSHFNYTRRYTQDFDKFLPSGKSDKKRNKYSKEELINAYDNSVLYTDHIIGRIIEMTNSAGGNSLLWYVPDHGENLLDDHKRLHLHGITNYYDLHVPSFIWTSQAYNDSFPNERRALDYNSNKPASFESLFHTLPHLAGISFQELDLSYSLADSSYEIRKRKALSLDDRLVNYDSLKPSIEN